MVKTITAKKISKKVGLSPIDIKTPIGRTRGVRSVGVKKSLVQKDPKKTAVQKEISDTVATGDTLLAHGPLLESKPGRDRYFEAVGRRKTAIARVRLYTKAGDLTVNDRLYGTYFTTLDLQRIVEDSLQKMKLFGRFRVSVKVSGGGLHSQAEAIRHALARCLTKFNPDFRKRLKRAGFLRRDPRMKERKKPGLKRARKAPQWAKR